MTKIPMTKKRNPLNLNALQLRTLTLLQELARLPEHASPAGEGGGVMVSNLPAPHGDHFHIGNYAVRASDATGLSNQAVFVALARKGLVRPGGALGVVVTEDGLAYDTGLRESILHGGHH